MSRSHASIKARKLCSWIFPGWESPCFLALFAVTGDCLFSSLWDSRARMTASVSAESSMLKALTEKVFHWVPDTGRGLSCRILQVQDQPPPKIYGTRAVISKFSWTELRLKKEHGRRLHGEEEEQRGPLGCPSVGVLAEQKDTGWDFSEAWLWISSMWPLLKAGTGSREDSWENNILTMQESLSVLGWVLL